MAHAKRSLVLRTAGINCDAETVRALERAGSQVELVHLHSLLDQPALLDGASLVVIPGGFSYGDDVSSGRIFGLELRHGLLQHLTRFVDGGGHVLGVCNGFQVLVESGLFEREPGAASVPARSIALTNNLSARFECRWVHLKGEACAATWIEPGVTFPVPMAHGEGRFVALDEATLQRLEARGQIALRYVRADGSPATDTHDNPNGSSGAIAGICDPTGRVFGLMPHPERNLDPWNHPEWTRLRARGARRTSGEGQRFWDRLVAVLPVPV
ncbi:MAG: Phosphoribosylformylglycinamidine synthase [Planctomycetota bacterium]